MESRQGVRRGGGCACALGGFLTVLGLILGLTLKKKPAGDA